MKKIVYLILGGFLATALQSSFSMEVEIETLEKERPEPKFLYSTPKYDGGGIPEKYLNPLMLNSDLFFKTQFTPECTMPIDCFLKDIYFNDFQTEDENEMFSKLSETLSCIYWRRIRDNTPDTLGSLAIYFEHDRKPRSMSSDEFCREDFLFVAMELNLLPKLPKPIWSDPDWLLQTYNRLGLTRGIVEALGYSTKVKKIPSLGEEVLFFADSSEDSSDEDQK